MEIRTIIENINKEFSEIGWGVAGTISGASVEVLREVIFKNWKSGQAKYFWMTHFSKNSLIVKSVEEALKYLVIIDITNLEKIEKSEARTVSFAVGKDERDREIIDRIKNGEKSFPISQDFFTCYFIKVIDENEEDYMECVKDIVEFKSLKDFTSSLSIKLDNWNDYGFYTCLSINVWREEFVLRVNPRTGEMINYLKGKGKKPQPDFGELCSLGGEEYYNFLKKYLPYKVRQGWLSRTRDLAYNLTLLDNVSKFCKDEADPYADKFNINQPNNLPHNFFNNSFMRTTNLKEIKEIFHPLTIEGFKNQKSVIVSGTITSKHSITESVNPNIREIKYNFDNGELVLIKNSSSYLPMNVYALVGGNGSGKSYTINEIIKRHMEKDNKFSNIFHFSLSPFDSVIRYNSEEQDITLNSLVGDDEAGVIYEKVGFSSLDTERLTRVKEKIKAQELSEINDWLTITYRDESKNTIKENFIWYIQDIMLDLISSREKLDLWSKALTFFEFESWASDILVSFKDREISLLDFQKINNLSSGQATILLYITKLVNVINRGCLVIFDEPETFMHPPMVKSFIRAVSYIVSSKEAFCLVATHSPIVIQEIPHCNIYRLNNKHNLQKISYKTYGQNLDTLYKNIYGIELQQTGYNSLLIERKEKIIESKDNKLLSDNDINYLGDEAFLKYLLLEDELNERGDELSEE